MTAESRMFFNVICPNGDFGRVHTNLLRGQTMQVSFTFRMGILLTQLEHDCKSVSFAMLQHFTVLFNAGLPLWRGIFQCGCVLGSLLYEC